MTVLVVDDDRGVRLALRAALRVAGYEVQLAADGELAVRLIGGSCPEAVLLDVGLPGIDGLEVCRRVRRQGSRVPILLMTGGASVADRIVGLDAGADDYLVKPFDVDELRARLRAVLRRAARTAEADALAFAELRLDRARHGVSVGARFTQLTRMEYRLLELFLSNPRTVLPHRVIYERVWGYDFGPASNALRVYISYLRRKLDRLGARELIHTVRGVGYVLSEADGRDALRRPASENGAERA
jgi:two-component system response regulator MprA